MRSKFRQIPRPTSAQTAVTQWQYGALPFLAPHRHRGRPCRLLTQATFRNDVAAAGGRATGMRRTSTLEQPHVKCPFFPVCHPVFNLLSSCNSRSIRRICSDYIASTMTHPGHHEVHKLWKRELQVFYIGVLNPPRHADRVHERLKFGFR